MKAFEKPEKHIQSGLSDFQKRLYNDRLQYLYQLLDNLKHEQDSLNDFCRINEDYVIREEIADILALLT
ncbi:MAG: hypothetical protein WC004_04640 [Candidatus Absconditabacterales bacterium]